MGLDYFYVSIYCDLSYMNEDFNQIDSRSATQIRDDNIQLAVVSILMLISVVCSFVVVYTILSNSKMRGHPNGLIALLAIANIGSCISVWVHTLETPKVVCYFGMA